MPSGVGYIVLVLTPSAVISCGVIEGTNVVVFITVNGIFDFIDNLPSQRHSGNRSKRLTPIVQLIDVYLKEMLVGLKVSLHMHVHSYGFHHRQSYMTQA
jgi:hypothetical protein